LISGREKPLVGEKEMPLSFFYFKVGPFQDEKLFQDYDSFVDYILVLRWKSGIRGAYNDRNLSGVYASGCIAR